MQQKTQHSNYNQGIITHKHPYYEETSSVKMKFDKFDLPVGFDQHNTKHQAAQLSEKSYKGVNINVASFFSPEMLICTFRTSELIITIFSGKLKMVAL